MQKLFTRERLKDTLKSVLFYICVFGGYLLFIFGVSGQWVYLIPSVRESFYAGFYENVAFLLVGFPLFVVLPIVGFVYLLKKIKGSSMAKEKVKDRDRVDHQKKELRESLDCLAMEWSEPKLWDRLLGSASMIYVLFVESLQYLLYKVIYLVWLPLSYVGFVLAFVGLSTVIVFSTWMYVATVSDLIIVRSGGYEVTEMNLELVRPYSYQRREGRFGEVRTYRYLIIYEDYRGSSDRRRISVSRHIYWDVSREMNTHDWRERTIRLYAMPSTGLFHVEFP
ncbi:MAG: hypothetical protein FWC89_04380 [Defluviitaleaceae bacterium]|nr:hypothetical protein [Defluviitaleaceae bacterium]